MPNRAPFSTFQLECVTSRKKEKKEKKRGNNETKLPCTGRRYYVQDDPDLQLLTSALEKVSVFLPGLFKW